MEFTKTKLAIIGLTIGLVVLAYYDAPTYLLQLCIVAIAGLGGFELRGQVRGMTLEWHQYYWRAAGYFLSFGGFGLVFDELIHGPIQFWPPGHETAGLVAGIIGLILVSVKPHGKD